MNRLEFCEVMKAAKIPLRCWHNFTIYFGDTYYTVIEGNVPLEVANIIYEKYPGNPYGIRIDGGCIDYKPSKHGCTSYHIDTKEGLVIFITEMKDYFARKNGLIETEAQRFDELMTTINSEILEKVKPSISIYEWMKTDDKNNEIFSQTISSETKTSFGKEFRRAIDEFDETVNPFINRNVELDEVGNYIQKVYISANVYNHVRKDCCKMHIIDLESKNRVSYYRSPDGFSYQLCYTFGEGQYLDFLHYYSARENDENNKGEVIDIRYFGDNISQKIDIKYNLTKGEIKTSSSAKTPVTPEQKEFIYNELLKAISLASSITLDNMKKKNYSKELVSTN